MSETTNRLEMEKRDVLVQDGWLCIVPARIEMASDFMRIVNEFMSPAVGSLLADLSPESQESVILDTMEGGTRDFFIYTTAGMSF